VPLHPEAGPAVADGLELGAGAPVGAAVAAGAVAVGCGAGALAVEAGVGTAVGVGLAVGVCATVAVGAGVIYTTKVVDVAVVQAARATIAVSATAPSRAFDLETSVISHLQCGPSWNRSIATGLVFGAE